MNFYKLSLKSLQNFIGLQNLCLFKQTTFYKLTFFYKIITKFEVYCLICFHDTTLIIAVYGCMSTSRFNITVGGTVIIVIAVNGSMNATRCFVTRVSGTRVVIVTIDRVDTTQKSGLLPWHHLVGLQKYGIQSTFLEFHLQKEQPHPYRN